MVIALLVLLVCKAGFHARRAVCFVWSASCYDGFQLCFTCSISFSTRPDSRRVIVGGIGLGRRRDHLDFLSERPTWQYSSTLPAAWLFHARSLVRGIWILSFRASCSFPPYGVRVAGDDALDERAKTTRAGREDGMGKAPGSMRCTNDPFVQERACADRVLYALLLGMALGYPDGRHRELSQTVRPDSSGARGAADRVRRVASKYFVQTFVRCPDTGCLNALMMASICFLFTDRAILKKASTFLLTNAVTCLYPLCFFICPIGRHVHQTTLLRRGGLRRFASVHGR